MSYYPDWCYGSAVCKIEGCDYGDGGICKNCGDRLRCHECHCFVRVDGYEFHYMKRHA